MTAARTAALLRLNLRQVSAKEEARASALSPPGPGACGSKGARETKRFSSAGGRRIAAFDDISFMTRFSCGASGKADSRIERREREIRDEHPDHRQHGDEHQDESGKILVLHAQCLQQDGSDGRQIE